MKLEKEMFSLKLLECGFPCHYVLSVTARTLSMQQTLQLGLSTFKITNKKQNHSACVSMRISAGLFILGLCLTKCPWGKASLEPPG